MRTSSRIRNAARFAVAAAAVAGLTAAGQSTAQAAPSPAALAATVTASPSTGVADGQRVTVSVTGLSPEAMLGQCAFPSGTLVCNPTSMVQFPTDAAGNGTRTITVRKSFQGYTLADDGSVRPWGNVTCGTATPCSIGATDGVQIVVTALSFR